MILPEHIKVGQKLIVRHKFYVLGEGEVTKVGIKWFDVELHGDIRKYLISELETEDLFPNIKSFLKYFKEKEKVEANRAWLSLDWSEEKGRYLFDFGFAKFTPDRLYPDQGWIIILGKGSKIKTDSYDLIPTGYGSSVFLAPFEDFSKEAGYAIKAALKRAIDFHKEMYTNRINEAELRLYALDNL